MRANAPGPEISNFRETGRTDPVSDVLQMVKLNGALFFMVDASSPWGVDVPDARVFASVILPRARHVISYHIVTKGAGWVSLSGDRPRRFAAGDVLVFPHQDRYAMLSSPGQRPELNPENALEFFQAMAGGKLPFVVTEGGGGSERAEFVCGFLGCDARPFNPLLDALPRLMHVRRPAVAANDLLDRLIDLTLGEAPVRRLGGECIRLRLSELIFVEVVRRYLESLPAAETGWLAGLRDPSIGHAISLLHKNPASNWSLQQLSRQVGLSRSVLASRFMHLTGYSPMQYLTRWRIQMAARRLADGPAKVAAVGRDVGYASEAAFSRAFRKIAGVSPAAWREQCSRPPNTH